MAQRTDWQLLTVGLAGALAAASMATALWLADGLAPVAVRAASGHLAYLAPLVPALAAALTWLGLRLLAEERRRRAGREQQYQHALQQAYQGVMNALNLALELKDHETCGHSRRVVEYSLAIARRLNLDDEQMRTLAWGAMLHDVGKIGVPDHILHKPGLLSDAERAVVREHVVTGAHMIRQIPFLAPAFDVIRYHHERFDGAGYPEQRRGAEIPLLARIFSVADAFDAMISKRPYRPTAMEIEAARQEIIDGAGTQFCPDAVRAFAGIPLEELRRIRREARLPPEAAPPWPATLDLPPLADRHDPLTYCLSRSAWQQRLRAVKDGHDPAPGAVVLVDLKQTRRLNERHGPAVTDRILADLAARLSSLGTEIYRLQEDDFCLLLPPGAWSTATAALLDAKKAQFHAYWEHIDPAIAMDWGAAAVDGDALEAVLQRSRLDLQVHRQATGPVLALQRQETG